MSFKLLANKYIELNIQDIRDLNGDEIISLDSESINYLFLFCRIGNINILVDDKEYHLQENEIFFVEPSHRIIINKGLYSCIFIQFNGSAVDELIYNTSFTADNRIVKDDESHYGYYFYKMYHAYHENDKISLKCLGVLYELFHELTKNSKRIIEDFSIKEKHIIVAKNYIYQNYNKEITITDVAKEVGVTSNYLSNIFAEYEKSTPKEYLTSIRMNQAKKMLLTSKYKIKEVGFLVGYKNQLHFSGEFKKYTGLSPLQYIKSNKN